MGNELYKITDNLILLERGTDELLLANAFNLFPMYVRKGKKYINAFVNYLQEKPRTRMHILEDYPHDEGLVDFLLKHNILISSDEQESASTGVVLPDITENKTDAMSVYFLLTQSCNFSCVYCLNGCKTYKRNENLMMPEEVAFKALDTFSARIKDNGRLEVVLFGGEPLLNWGLAKKIIIYCEKIIKQRHQSLNLHYHVTTNLGRLPNDFVEWACNYKITVLCDVDGNKELHNIHRPFKDGSTSFVQVCSNIKKLVTAGISVSLRTTVTALNEKHLLETTRLHKELMGESSSFVPVNILNTDGNILPDDMIPSLDQLYAAVHELYDSKEWHLSNLFPFNSYSGKISPGHRAVFGCGAPYGNTPVVDVDGNIYPCIYLVGIPAYHVGNIMDETYPETKKLQDMADELHVDRRDDCKKCSWRYLCGGGCPVQELIVKGRERELTPKAQEYCERLNCDYTKKILTILLWDAAQEADKQFRAAAVPIEGQKDARFC